MRIKEDYIMKKLGSGYVVVTIGEASNEFNGMIRLNAAGGFLWQSILGGADTRKKLITAMMERYDNLDVGTAEKDLDEFLQAIDFALEK